jgi:predicted nuclease of predicted toxin-antitoxin system
LRVLLDANLPVGLAAQLAPHEVQSVHHRGWSDLDNGGLLEAAAREYDAFLTLDQSIRYQQNLRDRPIAVVVLRARSSRIRDLEPLLPALLQMLPAARPGEVTIVSA